MHKILTAALSFAAFLTSFLFACGGKEETGTAEEEAAGTPVIRTIQTKHGDMRYFRFGNPDGKPFVILPGLSLKSVMGAAAAVESAYSLLAEEYDMYLFDRLSVYPEGYDVQAMAEDTFEAMTLLGLSDITLMGVSQGGMMAMVMAGEHPRKFGNLILCSSAASMKYANREAFSEWKKLAEKKDGPALMESFGRYVYSPEFFEAYKDAIIAQGEDVSDTEFANFLISVNEISDFNCHGKLGEISCPVYVLGAGEDQVLGVQASVDLMNDLHCDGYIYEGKGHGVYDEAPDYLARIKAFLDQEYYIGARAEQ